MTNENETTTDVPVEMVEEAPPTLAEVEREEREVAELRDRLDELPAEVEALDEEIAHAIANESGDLLTLRANRRERVELSSDLGAAHEVLTIRARDRREEATRELARKRLEAIEDEVVVDASLLDEDLASFLEAARAVADVANEMESRYAALVVAEAEAGRLVERFSDLDPPDLPTVAAPGRTDAARAALKLLRDIRVPTRPKKRVSIEGTSSDAIIAEAAQPERAGEDAKAADFERATRWLEDQLADGPVDAERLGALWADDGMEELRAGAWDEAVRRLGAKKVVRPYGGGSAWTLERTADVSG